MPVWSNQDSKGSLFMSLGHLPSSDISISRSWYCRWMDFLVRYIRVVNLMISCAKYPIISQAPNYILYIRPLNKSTKSSISAENMSIIISTSNHPEWIWFAGGSVRKGNRSWLQSERFVYSPSDAQLSLGHHNNDPLFSFVTPKAPQIEWSALQRSLLQLLTIGNPSYTWATKLSRLAKYHTTQQVQCLQSLL